MLDLSQQVSDVVRRISERLARDGIPNRRLTNLEVLNYRRDFSAGWRIAATFPDEVRRLDLLFGPDTPWQPPRVAVVDFPPFPAWPHVERDGMLCLLPNSASVNPLHPDDVAMAILGSSAELIEDLSSGKRDSDFKDEFRSYWDWHCDHKANQIYTLIDPKPPSRTLTVWIGQSFTVVAESKEAIQRWLRNRFPKITESNLETTAGVLIWMSEPPSPASFPKRGTDLVSLATANGANFIQLAEPIANAIPGELVVILGANSVHGPGFLGVSIQHPEIRNKSNPITKGFRANKVPAHLTALRFLDGRAVRTVAERADGAWIHGRDQDHRTTILKNSRVAVIGCGSLGSAIATMLASAGVGSFILVDPEQLTWANVGRHVLGAQSVGANKARAMSELLTSRFPHIGHIDFRDDTWQDALRRAPELFDQCNLVISATGEWASESHLNHWRLSTKPELCVVYGWTEAHGCAGHAVAIRDTGCLQCGFDEVGIPHLRVASWPDGVTMKQEPACGAAYQPYGPIELTHIVSLNAELAVGCLLGNIGHSTHRIWAGSARLLTSTGGAWTPEWIQIAKDRLQGSFVEDRIWPASGNCRRCFPEAA